MKRAVLAATTVAATALAIATPTPAQAYDTWRLGGFDRIQYDAPGPDRNTNESINREYFSIGSLSDRPLSLRGYTVRTRAVAVYHFGNYVLPPRQRVIVRTGIGWDHGQVRYWNLHRHVWNNSSDTATLTGPRFLNGAPGIQLERCSWNRPSGHGPGHIKC